MSANGTSSPRVKACDKSRQGVGRRRGVERTRGQLPHGVNSPGGEHPLGRVLGYHQHAADVVVVGQDRAIGLGEIRILEPPVPVEGERLVL